jgi:hypothetical protein
MYTFMTGNNHTSYSDGFVSTQNECLTPTVYADKHHANLRYKCKNKNNVQVMLIHAFLSA